MSSGPKVAEVPCALRMRPWDYLDLTLPTPPAETSEAVGRDALRPQWNLPDT